DDNRPVVPIGKPVDAEVYLLNPDLQPVAPGEVGEIYIGGPGLARGYFHRPEATAERFISHPWSKGARLYKTGDRA
ncbi:MAG TPA: AMP-binding protein, partial [Chthoniobacterales bacterium]